VLITRRREPTMDEYKKILTAKIGKVQFAHCFDCDHMIMYAGGHDDFAVIIECEKKHWTVTVNETQASLALKLEQAEDCDDLEAADHILEHLEKRKTEFLVPFSKPSGYAVGDTIKVDRFGLCKVTRIDANGRDLYVIPVD
jgi:hypothetical protein